MENLKPAIILTIICVVLLFLIYLLAERTVGNMRKDLRIKVSEGVVNRLLSGLNPRKYVLIRTVLLPTLKGHIRVDHLVISVYGLFVIEPIDWGGRVEGSQDAEEWKHCDSAGYEYSHPNPMIQKAVHIGALQEILGLGFDDFISIMTFISAVELDVNVDIPVTNVNNLTQKIKSYRDKRFTRKQMLYLVNEIKAHNISLTKDY